MDGINSLVDLIIEPVGENCTSGGFRVISGLDITNNKAIENSRIVTDDIPINSFKLSEKILNFIPQEQIRLGVRGTISGDFIASYSNSYLILARE